MNDQYQPSAAEGFGVFCLLGFLFGGVAPSILVLNYADTPVTRIRAAEAVCRDANSELVSLDRSTATCANRAEIPYEVTK